MQKQEKIVNMFNEIAPSYDKANKILSFGIDAKWRERAIESVKQFIKPDSLLVDIACGTADMCALLKSFPDSKIVGIDPSEAMLEIARKRFDDIEFKLGYADDLPLEDSSVDLITISYGFRNVVEKDKALKEFKRVLKPDAILLVLEFFKRDKGGIIGFFRDLYLKKILPIIGGYLSKNKAAYEYLPNSIDDFYSNDEFKKKLEEHGFKLLYFENFSFGVSSLFVVKNNASS